MTDQEPNGPIGPQALFPLFLWTRQPTLPARVTAGCFLLLLFFIGATWRHPIGREFARKQNQKVFLFFFFSSHRIFFFYKQSYKICIYKIRPILAIQALLERDRWFRI